MQPPDLDSTVTPPDNTHKYNSTMHRPDWAGGPQFSWPRFDFSSPHMLAHQDTDISAAQIQNASTRPALSFEFADSQSRTANMTTSLDVSPSAFRSSSLGANTPSSTFGMNTPPSTSGMNTPSSTFSMNTPSSTFGESSLGRKASPSFGDSSFGSTARPALSGNTSFDTKTSFATARSTTFARQPLPGSSSSIRGTFTPALPLNSLPSSILPRHSALKGNDALSRGMHRAALGRTAVIGRREIGADKLIAAYLDSCHGASDFQDLVADLDGIAQSHPTALKFLQYVFDDAACNRRAASSPRVTFQSKALNGPQAKLKDALRDALRQHQWPEDIYDYIIRMLAFDVSPRDIRSAVKAEFDQTHGHHHVSVEEVEDLIECIRGPVSHLVAEVRSTGTVIDMFRPSKREERKLAKLLREGDSIHNAEIGGPVEGDTKCPRCEKIETRSISALVRQADNERARRRMRDTTKAREDKEEKAFRFMDLPAEMRTWVLRSALVPGLISLRSCAHHMPSGVHPALPTSIFLISKTTKKEAEGMLLDNTIIVNASLESSIRPVIHRKQLPEHILPLIKSLVIVIDFTRLVSIGGSTDRPVDWRTIQGLTGMKKLRVCGIATPNHRHHLQEYLSLNLSMIRERIPTACEVSFGEAEGGQQVQAHVEDMVDRIRDDRDRMADALGGTRLEVTWETIEDDVVKGCKSGFKEDFRFEERRARGELDQHWLNCYRLNEEYELIEGKAKEREAAAFLPG